MSKEFNYFLKEGNIGFYNSCDVINIFLLYKKETYNYFSIFVLEESLDQTEEERYITPNLISIKKDLSLGIIRKRTTLDQIENVFDKLSSVKLSKINKVNLGFSKDIFIGKVEKNNVQFVPDNGSMQVPLNYVLKNNFFSGSYIYEFYDSSKESINDFLKLNKVNIKKINEEVEKLIPIKLELLQDRIGNVIFQLPVKIINVKSKYEKLSNSTIVYTFIDPRLKLEERQLIFNMSNMNDKVYNEHFSIVIKNEKTVCKEVNIESGFTEYTLYDLNNNLILHSNTYSLIREIHVGISVMEKPKERSVNGEKISIGKKVPITKIGNADSSFEIMLDKRIYEEKLAVLESNIEFKQYSLDINDGHNGAINDIRKLITNNDSKAIYLWDPYLSAEDIINTLFYSVIEDIDMKAITSSKVRSIEEDDIEKPKLDEWIQKQRKILDDSDSTGIRLEYRCQRDTFGTNFHDRFLMIVSKDKKISNVYSLGASINHIGHGHAIIQKVSNPEYIIDAFEELWEKLGDERCFIWKR